jgi:hypothetical protein
MAGGKIAAIVHLVIQWSATVLGRSRPKDFKLCNYCLHFGRVWVYTTLAKLLLGHVERMQRNCYARQLRYGWLNPSKSRWADLSLRLSINPSLDDVPFQGTEVLNGNT